MQRRIEKDDLAYFMALRNFGEGLRTTTRITVIIALRKGVRKGESSEQEVIFVFRFYQKTQRGREVFHFSTMADGEIMQHGWCPTCITLLDCVSLIMIVTDSKS